MQADAWGSARAGCDFPGMRLCAHHSYMPGLQVVRMAPASGRVRCSVPGICSRHAKLRMQWALLEEPRSVSCALCKSLFWTMLTCACGALLSEAVCFWDSGVCTLTACPMLLRELH